MITIKTSSTPIINRRVEMTCGECKKMTPYYDFQPRVCYGCGSIFPVIKQLEESKCYRIAFHSDGD